MNFHTSPRNMIPYDNEKTRSLLAKHSKNDEIFVTVVAYHD